MFGRNKNKEKEKEKIKESDKYSDSFKIHTMQNDIEIFSNVKKNIFEPVKNQSEEKKIEVIEDKGAIEDSPAEAVTDSPSVESVEIIPEVLDAKVEDFGGFESDNKSKNTNNTNDADNADNADNIDNFVDQTALIKEKETVFAEDLDIDKEIDPRDNSNSVLSEEETLVKKVADIIEDEPKQPENFGKNDLVETEKESELRKDNDFSDFISSGDVSKEISDLESVYKIEEGDFSERKEREQFITEKEDEIKEIPQIEKVPVGNIATVSSSSNFDDKSQANSISNDDSLIREDEREDEEDEFITEKEDEIKEIPQIEKVPVGNIATVSSSSNFDDKSQANSISNDDSLIREDEREDEEDEFITEKEDEIKEIPQIEKVPTNNYPAKSSNSSFDDKSQINRHSSGKPLIRKEEDEKRSINSSENEYRDVKEEDILKIIRERELKRKRLREDSPFSSDSKKEFSDIIPKKRVSADARVLSNEESHNFFPKIQATEENVEMERPIVEKKPERIKKVNNNDSDNLYEYEKSGSGGWFYIVILILIVVIAIGSYYLFVIKDVTTFSFKSFKDEVDYEMRDKLSSIMGDQKKGGSSDGKSQVEGYSDKINFLKVDENSLNKVGIRSLIDETFVKMNGYNGDQLEFVLVGRDNLPIKFDKFAGAFGISLNKNITNNALDNFSIFLSKKGGLKRMGIAINVKNKENVLEALRGEENNLFKGLEPILLGGEISKDSNKVFSDGSYKDVKIRFMGLNSNPDLSIDYSIAKNYLVFATSKESGRMIIDKILTEK